MFSLQSCRPNLVCHLPIPEIGSPPRRQISSLLFPTLPPFTSTIYAFHPSPLTGHPGSSQSCPRARWPCRTGSSRRCPARTASAPSAPRCRCLWVERGIKGECVSQAGVLRAWSLQRGIRIDAGNMHRGFESYIRQASRWAASSPT